MKLAHRTKWVEALRSGEYPQMMGFLKVNRKGVDKYCCLGVLCEVLKTDLSIELRPEDSNEPTIYQLYGHVGILGTLTLVKVGLTSHEQARLTDLNDYEGKTFAEIADWIEENIEATPEEEAGTSETV